MKKIAFLGLLLALFTMLSPSAYADILWEPDNSFYKSHADDCEYHDRFYTANGPQGYVTLYDAPNSGTPVAQVENGTELYIAYQYENWGCTSYSGAAGAEPTVGWLPLDQLVLVYDYLVFEDEFSSAFQPYQGEFADFDGDADALYCWNYPGAAEPRTSWKSNDGMLSHAFEDLSGDNAFSHTFTDEEGHVWGFCSYLYGIRNFWVCLDAPAQQSFPVREVSHADLVPAKKPPLIPAALRLPALLVLAAAGVTAGLLCGLYFKQKKPQ